MLKQTITIVAVAGLVFAMAPAALITPISATASTELSGAYDAGNLIDDSGLSGTARHAITDTHAAGIDVSWLSSGTPLPQTVTFDLGKSYLLSDVTIWQYAHPNANWAKDITIDFSMTGTGGTFGNSVSIAMDPGELDLPAQNFNLGGSVEANAVRFTITSREGGGAAHVGLSEVKFIGYPSALSGKPSP